MVGLPEQPTINLLYLFIYVFYEENNLRSIERSELERKIYYSPCIGERPYASDGAMKTGSD